MQQQGQEQCCLPATRCDVARKTLDTPCILTCLGYLFIFILNPRFTLRLCGYFSSDSVLTLQCLAWATKALQHHQPAGPDSAPWVPASPWAGLWRVRGKPSLQSPLAPLLHSWMGLSIITPWQTVQAAGRACQCGTSVGPFSQWLFTLVRASFFVSSL